MRTFIFTLMVFSVAACGRVTTPEAPDAPQAGPDAPDTGDELCFNGIDDDGDDLADCADDNCAPAALCVPLPENSNFAAGVVVAADEPCPPGFDGGETVIHRGLTAPDECTGCGCTAGASKCIAELWYYNNPDSCTLDKEQTSGIFSREIAAFTCDSMPINDNSGTGTTEGARANIITSATCTPNGTTTPAPVSWTESKKFCAASKIGSGCSAGSVCVAKQQPEVQCILANGSKTCDQYTVAEGDWYTDVVDTRTCTCECSATGDCSDVSVSVGTDFGCEGGYLLGDDEIHCERQYSPAAMLVGTPGAATCSATASITGGDAVATGQSTLCCMP